MTTATNDILSQRDRRNETATPLTLLSLVSALLGVETRDALATASTEGQEDGGSTWGL